MNVVTSALVLSIVLLIGMLACLEIGYRLGRPAGGAAENVHEGLGAVEAAVFALFGLLLAFAFSGATARLDARRQLIVKEASAISTAYVRLDLMPVAEQPAMRRQFRRYLETRLAAYAHVADVEETDRLVEIATGIQQEIWKQAVAIAQVDGTQNVARVVLPAINEMTDVTSARTVALRTTLPNLILALLVSVALFSALLAGYAMGKRRRRSVLHAVVYAVSVAVTFYVVLDLDNPRAGLIRLDAAEKILRDLRASIVP